MPMPKQLLQELNKFLSTLLHNIFATTAVGIIGVPVLISWATGTLDILLQILKSPTPLWATISLIALCCLYTYVRVVQILSKSERMDQASKPPPHETKYFTVGNYKWETKIYDNNYFEVDKYPYCIKHDLKFIFRRDSKYCPGTESEKCGYELRDSQFFEAYESAKSIIENKVRNKKY
jgi:hypothetical protein